MNGMCASVMSISPSTFSSSCFAFSMIRGKFLYACHLSLIPSKAKYATLLSGFEPHESGSNMNSDAVFGVLENQNCEPQRKRVEA